MCVNASLFKFGEINSDFFIANSRTEPLFAIIRFVNTEKYCLTTLDFSERLRLCCRSYTVKEVCPPLQNRAASPSFSVIAHSFYTTLAEEFDIQDPKAKKNTPSSDAAPLCRLLPRGGSSLLSSVYRCARATLRASQNRNQCWAPRNVEGAWSDCHAFW
ncbi:PREDICTED: PRELI domain containing protein 3A isoform X4 [Capra hircus]|uniref:PRELI domain containing protein 3A isoform X4 n=1 Tax=Capra hircus TaxID=9925 RepID=UPI0008468F57|nr:PREDICTED: PRELI domain containing protein 3A isoform X4 [Capra hircus]